MMRGKSKQQYSFTLIEMLIVIVIIGILAAALVPRLQDVQGRARDTERKADLRTIYTANEIYLLDNSRYARPGTGSLNSGDITRSTYSIPWIIDLTGIISTIPVDPLNVGVAFSATGTYHYVYTNVYTNNVAGAHTYDLWAKLENTRDAERNQVKFYYSSYPAVLLSTGVYPTLYDFSPNVVNSVY